MNILLKEESLNIMRSIKSFGLLNSISIMFLCSLIVLLCFGHLVPEYLNIVIYTVGIYIFVVWCILLITSFVSLLINMKRGFAKASIPLIINLSPIISVIVFDQFNSAQYLTDNDIVVNSKEFSPDKKHEIIEYMYDIGALGYSTMFTAVVATKDESHDLSKFRLPTEYKRARWLSNDTIEAEVDIRGYLATNKEFKQSVTRMGGIKIKVLTKGFDTSAPLYIEHRALSPDGRKELVVYRYRDPMNIGQLHISVVDKGAAKPTWGNLFIGPDRYDYINFAEWRKPNKIILYTNSKYMAQSYLLERPGIEVELIEKKNDPSSYNVSWGKKP